MWEVSGGGMQLVGSGVAEAVIDSVVWAVKRCLCFQSKGWCGLWMSPCQSVRSPSVWCVSGLFLFETAVPDMGTLCLCGTYKKINTA